ncbi:MAG: hypothetical protein GY816_20100 [Cytophagales bacterium]|nr:hypothetical protein [Cytophagales bacterium]
MEGQVTFVTSSSVYARFESTKYIKVGDTLRLLVDDVLTPCLVVKQKSSVSTVNTPLGGVLEKGTSVFTGIISPTKEEGISEESNIIRSRPVESMTDFDGSLSAATYLTGGDDMIVRNMYRADIKTKNINGSKLSAEAYVTLRQASSGEGGESSIDQSHYFNLYRASLRYDMTPETTLTLGRTINSKITSIGPMDGLQAEHRMKNL